MLCHIYHIHNNCISCSTRDGTWFPGLQVTGSPGQRVWPGRVGSRVSVSDPVFDQVLSFNMRVYRGIVSAE